MRGLQNGGDFRLSVVAKLLIVNNKNEISPEIKKLAIFGEMLLS
jgi:hypothetical protein